MSLFLAYNHIKQVINKNYITCITGHISNSEGRFVAICFNCITMGAFYRFVVAHLQSTV